MLSHRAPTLAHMSRFEQKYTPRQRDAVARAQVDDGLTANEALAAFHAGQLRDDAGAVPPPGEAMPKSTAHDLAQKLRRAREGRRGGLADHEPEKVRAELRRRLVVAADRLTAKVERAARAGKVSADELTKAAKAVAAVDAVLKPDPTPRTPPPPAKPPSVDPDPETPADASPLGALAREIDSDDRRAAQQRGAAASTDDGQDSSAGSAPAYASAPRAREGEGSTTTDGGARNTTPPAIASPLPAGQQGAPLLPPPPEGA